MNYKKFLIKDVNILDIIKNGLILIPFVKRIAKKSYKTGILNDPEIVSIRVNEILSIIEKNSIINASVLEIGPGQTSDIIIKLAKSKGIEKAFALDIIDYFGIDFWNKKGVNFINADLSLMASNSVDVVYCYDVLEHVKNPVYFLKELMRIVSKSGIVYLSWDLRDHFHFNDEESWFEMHKYNDLIWNLQMSNRTSYVNRLQMSQWMDNFESIGFEIISIQNLESPVASAAMITKYGLKINPVYRSKAIIKVK